MQTRLLSLAVGLVSLTVATTTMELMHTPWLDRDAFYWGVGIATSIGLAVGLAISYVRAPARHWKTIAATVLVAGAVVGMTMQALLYARVPEGRTYMLSSGLSTNHPFEWIAVGAGLGAIPAVIVAAAIAIAHRVASPVPSHDASVRLLVPFAGAVSIVAASSLGFADDADLPVIGSLLAFALLALGVVLLGDRRRAKWLGDLFAGRTPYEIVADPRAAAYDDVPLVVGAIFPRAFLMREATADYRTNARTPWARLSTSLAETIAPMLKRRRLVMQLVAATAVCGGLSFLAR